MENNEQTQVEQVEDTQEQPKGGEQEQETVEDVVDPQKELLTSLGFESLEDLQTLVTESKAQKQAEEDKRSEIEKATSKITEYEAQLKERESEIFTLKATTTALQNGVQADCISDVIILAKAIVDDKTDINKAIESVIAKYPHFANKQDEQKPTFSTKTNNEKPSETDERLISMRKRMGLI